MFDEHIPSQPPAFHQEIYNLFVNLNGNKAVAAPRGFAKSTITDLVILAWVALFAKRRFIILISDTFTQATMQIETLKAELESNEFIKWLFGDVIGELWSTDDIIVGGTLNNGSMVPVRIMAKGAGMKIRGLKFLNFRPDMIIIDDLENDELVQSEDRRRKLRNWLIRGVLPALAPNGIIRMIGTVLHRNSLLSAILDQREEFTGWQTRKYRAILGENQSLWPERFSYDHLIKMRDDPTYEHYIGPLAFAQEMMNTPMPEEDQIFQPDWLSVNYNLQEQLNIYHSQNPDIESNDVLKSWIGQTFKIISSAVDPAISEKEKADWWAMSTVGITKACPLCENNPPGHIMLLDVERMREKIPTNQAIKIIDSYRQWKQDKIKIESVQYQAGLYHLTMQKGAELNVYPPLRAFIPDRDKHRRAVIFSAVAAGKMFHMRKDHPLFNALYDEFITFPQGEHDDMIDAIFAACEDVTMKSRPRTFAEKPRGF